MIPAVGAGTTSGLPGVLHHVHFEGSKTTGTGRGVRHVGGHLQAALMVREAVEDAVALLDARGSEVEDFNASWGKKSSELTGYLKILATPSLLSIRLLQVTWYQARLTPVHLDGNAPRPVLHHLVLDDSWHKLVSRSARVRDLGRTRPDHLPRIEARGRIALQLL